MKYFTDRFLKLPQTRIGSTAVLITVVFVLLFLLKTNNLTFIPSFAVMALGIIGGILDLYAVIWKREFSWANILCLLPGLFAILFSAGELLYPH